MNASVATIHLFKKHIVCLTKKGNDFFQIRTHIEKVQCCFAAASMASVMIPHLPTVVTDGSSSVSASTLTNGSFETAASNNGTLSINGSSVYTTYNSGEESSVVMVHQTPVWKTLLQNAFIGDFLAVLSITTALDGTTDQQQVRNYTNCIY